MPNWYYLRLPRDRVGVGESPYFKELAHRFRGLARSEPAGWAGRWGPGGCSPLFWEAPLCPEGRSLAGEATRPRRTTGFVQPLPVSSTTSRKSPESTQMCGPAGAGPAAGQWPRRGARGRELLARLALPLQPQFPCRAGRPPSAHGASVPAAPALRRPWGSPGSPAPVLMAPGGKLQREAPAATADLSVSGGGCQSAGTAGGLTGAVLCRPLVAMCQRRLDSGVPGAPSCLFPGLCTCWSLFLDQAPAPGSPP